MGPLCSGRRHGHGAGPGLGKSNSVGGLRPPPSFDSPAKLLCGRIRQHLDSEDPTAGSDLESISVASDSESLAGLKFNLKAFPRARTGPA